MCNQSFHCQLKKDESHKKLDDRESNPEHRNDNPTC